MTSHRAWLEAECRRLLAFARDARVPGGFAWLDDHGRPDPERPLQLWITTRMTYVFSLGHLLGDPGSGPLVDHGLAALDSGFHDAEHGGWYPELRDGAPVSPRRRPTDTPSCGWRRRAPTSPGARPHPVCSNRRSRCDVYHAIHATLLPRLPVAASLAGALRADAGG